MSDTTSVIDAAALVRAALGADGVSSDLASGETPAPGRVVAAWGDDDVLAGLVTLEAIDRQVGAWRAALAVEVDERSTRGRDGLAGGRGCRNSRELMRRVTGAANVSVCRWLRLGRATRESTGLTGQPVPAPFPHVAESVAAGRINVDAALQIIDTLNPVRPVAGDAMVAVAEEQLVAVCSAAESGGVAPVDADSVRVQAATWAAFLDQDGTAPPETDLARRALRLGGLKRGLVRITGLLLPEVAAALAAFADACTNPRTPDVAGPGDGDPVDATTVGGRPDGAAGSADADGDEAALFDETQFDTTLLDDDLGHLDDFGDGLTGATPMGAGQIPPDPRTRPQLMHDVLAMALGAAARVADQRSVAGNSPTVLVSVRQSDLQARRGTGATFDGDRFGGPLPMSMAAITQLACSGATQRVALDDLGAIVGLWSPERCFTGQQRRAIALRDGGCIIPGCQVPAGWCEVHHITPHKDDPDGTHTSNGCLLCWYHHRTIETSGWDIRIRNGTPEVRPPAWLRSLTRAGPPTTTTNNTDTDDGWQPATGSPTRILDALNTQHRNRATSLAG
jgi:hypothetical protein